MDWSEKLFHLKLLRLKRGISQGLGASAQIQRHNTTKTLSIPSSVSFLSLLLFLKKIVLNLIYEQVDADFRYFRPYFIILIIYSS